jgi:hypothetical protein
MIQCEPKHVAADQYVLNYLKYSEISVLTFHVISALVGTVHAT